VAKLRAAVVGLGFRVWGREGKQGKLG